MKRSRKKRSDKFTLTLHPTGQCCKKIKGKFRYITSLTTYWSCSGFDTPSRLNTMLDIAVVWQRLRTCWETNAWLRPQANCHAQNQDLAPKESRRALPESINRTGSWDRISYLPPQSWCQEDLHLKSTLRCKQDRLFQLYLHSPTLLPECGQHHQFIRSNSNRGSSNFVLKFKG